jgi:4'-phosphopantetheinyl transferase
MNGRILGKSDSAHSKFELDRGLVHVWDSIGPADPLRYPDFFAMLDQKERERSKQFLSEIHRIRFVTCRGRLRLLLSAYTGLRPDEIVLTTDDYGKPRLNQSLPNTGLVFNVSHSSERMVFTMGLDCMLGVDIERIRSLARLEAIVDRICAEEEKIDWQNQPADRRLEYFFAIWVRKEAIIKAHGQGISLGLRECVLSQDLESPIRLPNSCGNVEDWALLKLDYNGGYSGAVAVRGPFKALIRREFAEQQFPGLY